MNKSKPLANRNRTRQSKEPIRTREKYGQHLVSAGRRVEARHDLLGYDCKQVNDETRL